MSDRDNRRFDRGNRVQTFGKQNAADFADGSKAKTHFVNLEALLKKVVIAKADQIPSRVSKATLLDALGLDLQNIARTARAIGVTENGFAAPYRQPDNLTEIGLTTHADAVLKQLEAQPDDASEILARKADDRAKFITFELPDDFVAHLRADRDAITGANELNQSETQDGVKSTKLIDELLTQINNEVVQLDTVMHNKYTRQPEKLRAWQSASHVERAPKRANKPTPAPVPTPA